MKRTILLLFFILSLPIISGFTCQGSIENETAKITPKALGAFVKWFSPITTYGTNPIIVDLDSDGKTEIIIGDEDGIINCLNYNGRMEWIFNISDINIWSTGTVADVDNDNKLEVIMSAGLFSPYIYCLEDSGILKWKHPSRFSNSGCGSAIGDINFDGELEIITTAMLGNVSCISAKNETLWDIKVSELRSAPVLFDYNNDIYLETIIQAPAMVYCLDHEGMNLWDYPISLGWHDHNTPALADFELDNEIEVVLCSNDTVYCLNSNGTLRWDYLTNERWISSPVIADLEGDDDLEVVFMNRYHVICLDDEGNEKWSYEIDEQSEERSPAIADFDGDNQMEIITFKGTNKTICLDSSGDLIWEIELENLDRIGASSPTICDLNGDRELEIILCSSRGIICLEVSGAKPIKCSAENRAPWRCFMGSTFRTGHRDRDSDFLDDQTELFYGTDIIDPDTDNDKICDGMEVFAGENPTINRFLPIYTSIGIVVGSVLITATIIIIRQKKKQSKKEDEIELID